MKQTKRIRLVEGSDRNTGFKKLGWENLPYTAIHAIAKLDLKIINTYGGISRLITLNLSIISYN